MSVNIFSPRTILITSLRRNRLGRHWKLINRGYLIVFIAWFLRNKVPLFSFNFLFHWVKRNNKLNHSWILAQLRKYLLIRCIINLQQIVSESMRISRIRCLQILYNSKWKPSYIVHTRDACTHTRTNLTHLGSTPPAKALISVCTGRITNFKT